jgi:NAD(P)-dependent dehydrogenase (short-subunit alcohol dehydrogenase family)
MLLKDRNAIVYGAAGSLGGAIAKAFAKEGAKLFLAGRTQATLEKTAGDIISAGGTAEMAVVDALDETAVKEHMDTIVQKHGHIDICFNAIATNTVQGIPLYEMKLDDFIQPLHVIMQSQLVTAAAAAKHMINQGSGVILFLTATPAGIAYPFTGGFGVLCNAIEGFSRNLAAELGPKGVRVACMRSAGSPDSKVFEEAKIKSPDTMKARLREMENDTMLKRLPMMQEIANVAVFLASGMASGMTGTSVNITCGTTVD